ncbi:hypothetical protein MZE26_20955, partial [Escherichia coli]|nr:hypothetical protein [Escherichia coli]MCK2548732.1 hypothetical protein [Escherichia coli]
KRAYCLKTQPATGETYPKSDLFNKAGVHHSMEMMSLFPGCSHKQVQTRGISDPSWFLPPMEHSPVAG